MLDELFPAPRSVPGSRFCMRIDRMESILLQEFSKLATYLELRRSKSEAQLSDLGQRIATLEERVSDLEHRARS